MIPSISSFPSSLLLLAKPHSLALLPIWPFVPASREGFFFTLACRGPQGSESAFTSRPIASTSLPQPAQPSITTRSLLRVFSVSDRCMEVHLHHQSWSSPPSVSHFLNITASNWLFLTLILSSLSFHSKTQSGSVLCLLKPSKWLVNTLRKWSACSNVLTRFQDLPFCLPFWLQPWPTHLLLS